MSHLGEWISKRGVDELENPEIKVLIAEIAKLRGEIIEMKMEIEGLKADVLAIGSLNRVSTKKVLEENSQVGNSFRLIKTKKQSTGKSNEKQIANKVNTEIEIQNNSANEEKVAKTKQVNHRVNKIKDVTNVESIKIEKSERKLLKEKLQTVINSDLRYDTWLKMGVNNLSHLSNGDYIFPAPNDFTRGILEVRYREMVEAALREVFTDVKDLKFIVVDEASAM